MSIDKVRLCLERIDMLRRMSKSCVVNQLESSQADCLCVMKFVGFLKAEFWKREKKTYSLNSGPRSPTEIGCSGPRPI